jgi:hypothetical protein
MSNIDRDNAGGDRVKKSVDEFIAELDDWQADIVTNLRELVVEAAPEAEEAFKWSQPVFESHGPFTYIKVFKDHINFGFWRGADLKDPEGLLEGSGKKMRHVPLKSLEDIERERFQAFVREAVELNRVKGDPTKGD